MEFQFLKTSTSWLKCMLAILICFNAKSSFSQCYNTSKFPSSEVYAPGYIDDTKIIVTNQYAGEYMVLINLNIGNSYTFNSSSSSDFVTVRATGGISSDPSISFGPTPHTFIATSHTHEVHINLSSPFCGLQNTNRITSITCNDCPVEPPKIGIQTSSPAAVLDVAGEIKIGDITRDPVAGMIRYSYTNSDFEGYNGTNWISLTQSNSQWGKVPNATSIEDNKIGINIDNSYANFGHSVAIDGDYAVVGSYGEDIGSNAQQGAAYIYKRSGSIWVEQAKLIANDGEVEDWFGKSVSIDGDYVIIGSYGVDIGSNIDQGSAYVFKRTGDNWSQEAKLVANDGISYDYFGNAVCISGNYIVIGCQNGSIGSNLYQGSAYIFEKTGSSWSQGAKLFASDGESGDNFGISVSISGNDVIVGSFFDDIGINAAQGSAYVFKRSGNSWIQDAKLITNGNAFDNFGISVSISGDYCVIGSNQHEVGSNGGQGSAIIFKRSGNNWIEEVTLTANDGESSDNFGTSVCINGDYVVIGAENDDIGSVNSAGSTYIYKFSDNIWKQVIKLQASDGALNDHFGVAVSISGNSIIVGSDGVDNGSYFGVGAVYFFENK